MFLTQFPSSWKKVWQVHVFPIYLKGCEGESDESPEEGSCYFPLADQLQKLAVLFLDKVVPTNHSFSSYLWAHSTADETRDPICLRLPLDPTLTKKFHTQNNSFKYNKKSILPKENKFLPKEKLPSNLPFKKSRYSPNDFPDFTSGYLSVQISCKQSFV